MLKICCNSKIMTVPRIVVPFVHIHTGWLVCYNLLFIIVKVYYDAVWREHECINWLTSHRNSLFVHCLGSFSGGWIMNSISFKWSIPRPSFELTNSASTLMLSDTSFFNILTERTSCYNYYDIDTVDTNIAQCHNNIITVLHTFTDFITQRSKRCENGPCPNIK